MRFALRRFRSEEVLRWDDGMPRVERWGMYVHVHALEHTT